MRKIVEGRCIKQRHAHEGHHWYDAHNDRYVHCDGEPLFNEAADGHESVAGGNNA